MVPEGNYSPPPNPLLRKEGERIHEPLAFAFAGRERIHLPKHLRPQDDWRHATKTMVFNHRGFNLLLLNACLLVFRNWT